MPDVERWKQRIIALSGFGAELSAALLFCVFGCFSEPLFELGMYFAVVALLHFGLYRFYAGESSDFKWL